MEFAILTNEIYKTWSGMTARQYKDYKGLKKESLRDNMTEVEVILTDLGEVATRELTKKHEPYGLNENKIMANKGGNIAKITKDNLEKELRESVITHKNNLDYKHIDDKILINN